MLLDAPTQPHLAGASHIDQRLISLDALAARPSTKGKSYPSPACGTALQMPFNRPGFMMPTDTFIGQPTATTLYGPTVEHLRARRQAYPGTAVTDLGFRSATNLKLNSPHI